MNRRSFLTKSAATGLTLATLPLISTLTALGQEAPAIQDSEDETFVVAGHRLTEQDVLDLTLQYLDSWEEYLPHQDLREKFYQYLAQKRQA